MTVGLYTHDQIVSVQAAAVQAKSPDLIDFTPGSILLALLEGNASVALWEQALILQVMALTRAATSNGSALDTWMADYFFIRAPAVAAAGQVTFSRYSPTLAAVIPAGVTVTSADSTQAFQVTIDTTNPAWVQSLLGYQLPAGQASVTVPVLAQVAGAGGNVVAGAISLIANAISLDTVTNAAAFTTGVDAESDDAFRARFRLYIASLSRATPSAIAYAVSTVQQGLTSSIAENVAPDGTYRPGFFVVTVDDGSGAPSSDLLARVYTAVDAYRPVGTAFAIQPPTLLLATISLTLTLAAGTNRQAVLATVNENITAYINDLSISQQLRYGQLYRLAYDADPGIVGVSSLLLNGGTVDVGGGVTQVVRTASVIVS